MYNKEPETILVTDDGKFKLIENVTDKLDCYLCCEEGQPELCNICGTCEYFVEIV